MKITISKKDLQHIQADITCGLHSGFPPCCIKYYITKWIWWDINSYYRRKFWDKWRAKFIGYIPCPQCRKKKNFVKVKKCPKNCVKRKLVALNRK